MHEVKTQLMLGRHVPALRRFEDAEVARLRVDRPEFLVTTVMATYKRPSLLPIAVESALAQTVTDHQVIVVDDGGGLPSLPDDPRVVAVSLSRNTAIAGLVRNVGIRLTRSRYVAFLDDDNTWRPDHLETMLAGLRRGADLVYSAVERHYPDGTVLDVLSTPFDRKSFVDDSPYVDTNAIVVRRGPLFSRIPRVTTTFPKEDWEFVYRASRHGVVTHIPEPTVRYLINEGSYYTDWRSPH